MKYSRKTKKNGPIKTFGKGRLCKKTGCKQRLSVYNSEKHCHIHLKEFSK